MRKGDGEDKGEKDADVLEHVAPVLSATPSQRAWLHRIHEGRAVRYRLGPSLLEAVVPHRRNVRILDEHQRRIEGEALFLELHDAAVVAQEGGTKRHEERLQETQPCGPEEYLRHLRGIRRHRRADGEAGDIHLTAEDRAADILEA